MSYVRSLIQEMNRLGVSLEPRGYSLHVSAPAGIYGPALRQTLLTHKDEILAALAVDDPEVAWRCSAMRPTVPPAGPVPFLVARAEALAGDAPRLCMSCGTLLAQGRVYRCDLCVRAVEIVLNERREG